MEFLYTIISIFEYLGDRMKERLDIILVQDGYFDTREKAKRAIMAGIVLVDDKKIDKAGTIINLDKNPQISIKRVRPVSDCHSTPGFLGTASILS